MSATITVEKTEDESYIKSVFLNPTIYDEMKDDSCPMEPSMLGGTDIKAIPGFFLRVLMGSESVGVFWLIWKGESVEAHTALLPACRGRNAIRAVHAAMQWVWGHTAAKAVTSYAWSDSPAVAWFCRAVGMETDRTEAWPFTRGGRRVDITYFKIGRTT